MTDSFQIFLIVVFALVAVCSIVALVLGIAPKLSLMTLVISLLACGAAIWPDSTTRIAQQLGLDRGKDLLLYCSVVVMMAGFFLLYVRLRQMRRELTLMVRHVALMEAHEGAGGVAQSAGRGSPDVDGRS